MHLGTSRRKQHSKTHIKSPKIFEETKVSRSDSPGEPKPNNVVAEARREADAIRRARDPRTFVPGAAANDAAGAISAAIFRIAVVVHVTILNPFRHIAEHVVQPEQIRLE